MVSGLPFQSPLSKHIQNIETLSSLLNWHVSYALLNGARSFFALSLQSYSLIQNTLQVRKSDICPEFPNLQAMTLETVFQQSVVASKVHPAIMQLGLKYADGSIAGGNARCLAMLLVFKTVIQACLATSCSFLSNSQGI